jgi:hypothetical protein
VACIICRMPLPTPQFVLISDVNRKVHVINLEHVVQLTDSDKESSASIELTNGNTILVQHGDASRGMITILQNYNSQASD